MLCTEVRLRNTETTPAGTAPLEHGTSGAGCGHPLHYYKSSSQSRKWRCLTWRLHLHRPLRQAMLSIQVSELADPGQLALHSSSTVRPMLAEASRSTLPCARTARRGALHGTRNYTCMGGLILNYSTNPGPPGFRPHLWLPVLPKMGPLLGSHLHPGARLGCCTLGAQF